MSLRCELRRDLIGIEAAWDALIGDREPLCLCADWISAYFRHFGGQEKPCILCIFDGSTLVGGLALAQGKPAERVTSRLLGRRVLYFAGRQAGAEFADLLAVAGREEAVADSVANWLCAEARAWDRMWLACMLPDSAVEKYLVPALRRLRMICSSEIAGARYTVDLPDDHESYVASLGRRTRKSLRRDLRQADAVGASWRLLEDRTERAVAYAALMELHIKRFGSDGAFAKSAFVAMHAELIEHWRRSGIARLGVLEHEGGILAAELSYRIGGTEYAYQGAFNPEFEGFSVGKVALHSAIRSAIEDRIDAYDLMFSVTPDYKTNLGCRTTPVLNTLILPFKPRSLLFYLARRLKRLIGSVAQ